MKKEEKKKYKVFESLERKLDYALCTLFAYFLTDFLVVLFS